MFDKPGSPVMRAFSPLLAVFLTLLLVSPFSLAFNAKQVFDRAKGSVVVVRTLDEDQEVLAQGSGVMLPDGNVGTTCHVLQGAVEYVLENGTLSTPATYSRGDWERDICVLRPEPIFKEVASPTPLSDRKYAWSDFDAVRSVELGTKAVLGSAASLSVGDPVYAIGAPRGLELSLSAGIVSQLRGSTTQLIQTTAAISPGSSGGGLFDSEGRIIGLIVGFVEGGQSLNFAVPIEWLRDLEQERKVAPQRRTKREWERRAIELKSTQDWHRLYHWCELWWKSEPEDDESLRCHIEAKFAAFAPNVIGPLRRQLQENASDSEGWRNLGREYGHLGKRAAAVRAYRRAIALDSSNAVAWFELGREWHAAGRDREAIEALRQTVNLQPDFVMAWYYLGWILFEQGDHPGAMEALRQLDALDAVQAKHLAEKIVPK